MRFTSDYLTGARAKLRAIDRGLYEARAEAESPFEKRQLDRASDAVLAAIRTLTDARDTLLREGL